MLLDSHPEYIVRKLPRKDFFALIDPHIKTTFKESFRFPDLQILTDREKQSMKQLRSVKGESFRLNLALFKGDKLAGWSFGWQKDSECYYMTNSAILEEHRRQGLYSALLKKVVEIAREKGFQIIFSRHTATNNAILVPKLKAGFIISAMEISDTFGLLIHLRYYTNPLRRKMMDVRCGESKPDSELRGILGLTDD